MNVAVIMAIILAIRKRIPTLTYLVAGGRHTGKVICATIAKQDVD
jgi:hypothetical protein